MLSTPQEVLIPIDYSVMFDTQYATYVHNFVNEQTNKFNNEVWKSIDVLLREDFHYDYSFYIFENSKQINLDSPFNINEFKNTHNDIFNNITSLELFKSIDHELYKQKGKVFYTINKAIAEIRAEKIISESFGSELGIASLKKISFLQKQMTLFLIGVFKIKFSSNKNAPKKIVELMDFMHNKVGIYFDREAVIAYKYFKNNHPFNIFNRIQKNSEVSLKTINNISWDFMVPRIMETLSRLNHDNSYFLPFVLTHDIGLKEVIKSFDVKGILLGDKYGAITIPYTNTKEYFESEQCKIDTDFYFSEESLLHRKNIVKGNEKNIDWKIDEEYILLIEALLK